MALTANAKSALPSWDEAIVPSLRKRLESESRILANRMSVASLSSVDDSPRSNAPSHSGHSSRDHPANLYPTAEPRKSSAIPRPSLQHPRTTTQDNRSDASANYTRVNGASASSTSSFNRARTYSQPYAHLMCHGQMGIITAMRFRLPPLPVQPPLACQTHAYSIAPTAESRNGILPQPYRAPTPEASAVVKQSDPLRTTTPPMSSVRHQASSIMNEPVPFAPSSITSSTRSRGPTYQAPRPSNDSEERPFEHWYRGDVHRNGGVGELRVAKHMEMLQIANYGHNLRRPVQAQARNVSGPMGYGGRRKRADSVDTGTRESLYLDDDHTKDVDMVLDEDPLTDIEADPDTDFETFYDAYAGTDADNAIPLNYNASMPGLPLASAAETRSETPTNIHPAPRTDTTPKHVPVTRSASEPLGFGSPSGPPRTSAESTMPTPRSHSRTASPTSLPKSQSSSLPPTKASSKKPCGLIGLQAEVQEATPSIAEGRHAKFRCKVVPPVLARKKGLDGQYEQADGSPRPKSPERIRPVRIVQCLANSMLLAQFGFDWSKYRAPRGDDEIPMNEFGQLPEPTQPLEGGRAEPPQDDIAPEPIPLPVQLEEPIRLDSRRIGSRVPDAHTPFSQYHATQVPTISVTRPSSESHHRPEIDDEGVGGGCCKCVIM
ncbi:hypothetical protein BU15DRAFT_73560 [Melanogaster broomeanus]|nr:hypothetical protein BU15DRAFT_73560 [Melanogaster broomeanus]